jgi:hypothetical protein
MRIGGGTIDQRIDYALEKLGKEINFRNLHHLVTLLMLLLLQKERVFKVI